MSTSQNGPVGEKVGEHFKIPDALSCSPHFQTERLSCPAPMLVYERLQARDSAFNVRNPHNGCQAMPPVSGQNSEVLLTIISQRVEKQREWGPAVSPELLEQPTLAVMGQLTVPPSNHVPLFKH